MPKITVASASTTFSDDGHGALYNYNKTQLYAVPTDAYMTADCTYTINPAVEEIKHSAFISFPQNTGIKKIILPPHLKNAATDYPRFAQINTLEAYEMPAGATGDYKVDGGVLFYKDKLVQYPRNKQDKDYKVPNGIKGIYLRAFDAVRQMESIDMNQVTKLDVNSLFGCQNLKTVTLPKDLESAAVAA